MIWGKLIRNILLTPSNLWNKYVRKESTVVIPDEEKIVKPEIIKPIAVTPISLPVSIPVFKEPVLITKEFPKEFTNVKDSEIKAQLDINKQHHQQLWQYYVKDSEIKAQLDIVDTPIVKLPVINIQKKKKITDFEQLPETNFQLPTIIKAEPPQIGKINKSTYFDESVEIKNIVPNVQQDQRPITERINFVKVIKKKRKPIKLRVSNTDREDVLKLLNSSIELFNVWRERNSFKPLWINNANLSETNLSGVNWKGCILLDVDFSKTMMVDASFKGSILRNVNMNGADLRWANFSGVDLSSVTGVSHLKENSNNNIGMFPTNRWLVSFISNIKSFNNQLEIDPLLKQLNLDFKIQDTKKYDAARINKNILEYTRAPKSINSLMIAINEENRTIFRNNHLKPLLQAGLLQMTIPDAPKSKNQTYITTMIGIQYLERLNIAINNFKPLFNYK